MAGTWSGPMGGAHARRPRHAVQDTTACRRLSRRRPVAAASARLANGRTPRRHRHPEPATAGGMMRVQHTASHPPRAASRSAAYARQGLDGVSGQRHRTHLQQIELRRVVPARLRAAPSARPGAERMVSSKHKPRRDDMMSPRRHPVALNRSSAIARPRTGPLNARQAFRRRTFPSLAPQLRRPRVR
jgi:hypothetical protein